MKMLNFNAIVLSTSILFLFRPCHADTNAIAGTECSEADNSTSENAFQTKLNNLLNSLAAKGILQHGFHTSTEGKGSNKIYGLAQCRGDVFGPDCENCTKESIRVAENDCSQSKKVKVWFKWCFLRYSDEDFFGIWDQTSEALTNDTNFDDPSVVSRGFNFMTELAITAPKQPQLFQTSVFDAGATGKRYGMAQCTRDISRSDCSKCLDNQLMTFRTTVGNKRGWEIYGSSCSMWYHDFQFFFNISSRASEGFRISSLCSVVAVAMMVAVLKLLLIL
ncbi:cysteine-rich repeat secretory protein 38-like [Pistacia vera]|uniref:cysteine-rich repeat secretory protein 38-like n=1 Tax=Pistacia vera TaxID=55513 RepID=UPI001262F06A|nr:cysteine-rich repeat secretory protein 38-like [Pistacia vera]